MKKLKGIKRYERNGKIHKYFRATGERLPADIPETDPRLLHAYKLAEQNAKSKGVPNKVQANTVEDLYRRVLTWKDFSDLSVSYQNLISRELKKICRENDGRIARLSINKINAMHIKTQVDNIGGNAGRTRYKAWNKVFELAVSKQLIKTNPCEIVTPPKERVSKQGHAPWTNEEIEQFRQHWPHGTVERLAFELQYWAGARISDTRQLGWDNIDSEGWLTFTQQKTGEKVSIPFDRTPPWFAELEDLQHLKAAIAAMPSKRETWFQTQKGDVRTEKGASQWFAKAARKAGIQGRTSHGLRKKRMIVHAENGASEKEIAAWSGHESLKEVQRYVRAASKKRLLSATTR
ncbi:MAG: tyrosine-type recombinase/integrase [Rhodobacteraceae bacterium]|nr:tyrosine-type recombinase/integrase [Paracoccaceae bacterium]